MTGPHFVDSNVLAYQHDRDQPNKRRCADRVLDVLWRQRGARISVQVLSELYATCTRRLGVPAEVARRAVRALEQWSPVPLSAELRENAWRIEDRYGFSCWDAMIVAAAHQSGCRVLLTEDLQDGQNLDGMVVMNPFIHTLEELGLAEV